LLILDGCTEFDALILARRWREKKDKRRLRRLYSDAL